MLRAIRKKNAAIPSGLSRRAGCVSIRSRESMTNLRRLGSVPSSEAHRRGASPIREALQTGEAHCRVRLIQAGPLRVLFVVVPIHSMGMLNAGDRFGLDVARPISQRESCLGGPQSGSRACKTAFTPNADTQVITAELRMPSYGHGTLQEQPETKCMSATGQQGPSCLLKIRLYYCSVVSSLRKDRSPYLYPSLPHHMNHPTTSRNCHPPRPEIWSRFRTFGNRDGLPLRNAPNRFRDFGALFSTNPTRGFNFPETQLWPACPLTCLGVSPPSEKQAR